MSNKEWIYKKGVEYQIKYVKLPWWIRWNPLLYLALNCGAYTIEKHFVEFINDKGIVRRVYVRDKKINNTNNNEKEEK